MSIERIVSGGQTGVDRAALDLALELGIKAGGWAPKGRMAEDGPLPERYRVTETPSGDPAQRTEWNVRDSDATPHRFRWGTDRRFGADCGDRRPTRTTLFPCRFQQENQDQIDRRDCGMACRWQF
jgi:hypothetical protein